MRDGGDVRGGGLSETSPEGAQRELVRAEGGEHARNVDGNDGEPRERVSAQQEHELGEPDLSWGRARGSSGGGGRGKEVER